jgi:hypothetical protein
VEEVAEEVVAGEELEVEVAEEELELVSEEVIELELASSPTTPI